MLRECLKRELDKLDDEQLQKVADFIALIEFQSKQVVSPIPLWQRLTPTERAREFRQWVLQLPQNSPTLPDEAFNRDSIY
jgi:hypothetical protein